MEWSLRRFRPRRQCAGASKTPHISRTVLRAAAQTNEPVIANDLARLPRFQAEMTISPDSSKFSAVACPLRSGGGTTDVLYVLLPPDRGTVEWLMLLTLAAEEFRHADAAWAARAAAGKRAAWRRDGAWPATFNPARCRESWPLRAWIGRCATIRACGAGDYVDVVHRRWHGAAAGRRHRRQGNAGGVITSGLHSVFHTQGRSAPLVEVVNAANCYLRTYLPDSSFVTFAALQLNPQTGEAVCAGTAAIRRCSCSTHKVRFTRFPAARTCRLASTTQKCEAARYRSRRISGSSRTPTG